MKLSLLPREVRFFELFNQQAAIASLALAELSKSLLQGQSGHARLRELEHQADDVAHEIYMLTNMTFAPPAEPEDILSLAHALDDVVDLAEEVSDKIELYNAYPIPKPAAEMADCLACAGKELEQAVRSIEDAAALAPALLEIHNLENRGDRVTRDALENLFSGGSSTPADLIKWKELYDLLELTMDQCETVAEIIETVSLKSA
ncbi:MAG TPA: DUF47 family protein [Candidatus Dormibacteraeota bacterium]|nr:DUF47 family protein [Candidatus Dormibacteraeota bacterium]